MTHYLYSLRWCGVDIYVGVTKIPVERFRRHRCSRPLLGVFLREKGSEVSLKILATGSRSYIYDLEIRAIVAFATQHPLGFNLSVGGQSGRDPLPSTRAKIAAARKGRVNSPETRARISAGKMGHTYNLGQIRSAETRAKIAVAIRGHTQNVGRIHSAETRARMSAAQRGNTKMLGRVHSVETRAKLSKAQTGRVHSAETRAKMSVAARKRQGLLSLL